MSCKMKPATKKSLLYQKEFKLLVMVSKLLLVTIVGSWTEPAPPFSFKTSLLDVTPLHRQFLIWLPFCHDTEGGLSLQAELSLMLGRGLVGLRQRRLRDWECGAERGGQQGRRVVSEGRNHDSKGFHQCSVSAAVSNADSFILFHYSAKTCLYCICECICMHTYTDISCIYQSIF